MRVLIDTNVLISAALFPNSVPAHAYAIAMSGNHVALVCEQNIEEMSRIFLKKFPHKKEVLESFLASSMLSWEIVPVPTNEVAGEAAVRDINDRPILRAAVLAEADLLLSGDKDFLEAKIARPKVLTPADFVKGYGQA